MTFISTVISQQGIILAADSKELIQGGRLLWEDFDDILKANTAHEDDNNPSISPFSIKQKFKDNSVLTNGRVLSRDGAQKIFQIGIHFAILISGTANPGGKEFSEIVKDIKKNSKGSSFDDALNATFLEINKYMDINKASRKDKSEILFCGYDKITDSFKVFKFTFVDKYLMDENGDPKVDANGMSSKDQVYRKYNRTQLVNFAGWIDHVQVMESTLNQRVTEINILDGFMLSKKIMELVIAIENVSNLIPGIGGRVYYAAITQAGFKYISSEADLMNMVS